MEPARTWTVCGQAWNYAPSLGDLPPRSQDGPSLEAVVAKFGTIKLKGASGKSWTFDVWPRDTEFNALGVVYVQSVRTRKADGTRTHRFIYVGQTGDLSHRPLNHHMKGCVDRH